MAIKLKALRLQSTTGMYYKAVDPNDSASNYQSTPIQLEEIYYQDTTGVLAGVRIGTEHNIWVSTKYNESYVRGEKIVIGNNEFTIQDIKEEFHRTQNGSIRPNSAHEPHFQLTIMLPND